MPRRTSKSNIARLLEPGGPLSSRLPAYEYRPQQVEACTAVQDAFAKGRHCMVEAGTGVGKTLAYLIPAVMAAERGKKTVISTYTIGLQTQLIRKDIPLVQDLLPHIRLKPVLMKGRGNYLCQLNLDAAEADIFNAMDPVFAQLKQWAGETETGDRDDLPFRWQAWGEVAADQYTCRSRECRYFERCHYYRMRREAQDANLIVVNHALFLSDLKMRLGQAESAILPDYDYVVFDEAHHLEGVATDVFGVEVEEHTVPGFLDRVRRTKGFDIAPERLLELEVLNSTLFGPFETDRQEFFVREALDDEGRTLTESTAREVCERLGNLAKDLLDQSKDAEEGLKDRLQGLSRIAGGLGQDLQTVVFAEEDAGHIRWGERPFFGGTGADPARGRGRRPQSRTTLHYTPVFVGDLLEQMLWGQVESVVLTSATLSNSGGFSYLRARLSVPDDADERIVGSPFDFKQQAILYVPGHLPAPPKSPSERWVEAVAAEIERVVTLTEGRAFLLFTSRRMLNLVYDELKDRLPWPLFRQGDLPAGRLLDEFKASGNGVLFGTQTFWEGVDVQGDALSCVVIDRLPFAVPDSPVNRARTAAITDQGGDWFGEFAMPQAQLRLKQGFGRLIRTHTDRGIVCILDSRLIHQRYGKEFVDHLPPAARASLWPRVEKFWKG